MYGTTNTLGHGCAITHTHTHDSYECRRPLEEGILYFDMQYRLNPADGNATLWIRNHHQYYDLALDYSCFYAVCMLGEVTYVSKRTQIALIHAINSLQEEYSAFVTNPVSNKVD